MKIETKTHEEVVATAIRVLSAGHIKSADLFVAELRKKQAETVEPHLRLCIIDNNEVEMAIGIVNYLDDRCKLTGRRRGTV